MVTPKGGWGNKFFVSKDPEIPSSTSLERDIALGVVHSRTRCHLAATREKNLGENFEMFTGKKLACITFITRCNRLRDLGGGSGTRNGHFGAFGPINVAGIIAADTSCWWNGRFAELRDGPGLRRHRNMGRTLSRGEKILVVASRFGWRNTELLFANQLVLIRINTEDGQDGRVGGTKFEAALIHGRRDDGCGWTDCRLPRL